MADDDSSEFARLFPGVKRMRQDRVNLYREREHKSFDSVNPAVDPASPGTAPSTAAAPSHFNPGLQKKLQRRIRRGEIRPQSSLDLHGCRQQQALGLLREFVGDALARNLRMLLIVHGQGLRSQHDAVLKPLVLGWLAQQPQVLAWCPAQPRDGAAGATYVYLRSDD